MSNSKSEDTPDPSRVDELTDKLRGLLNKDGVWSSEYNGVLLEIEELATSEPPQDTSLDDKATQHTHKWSHVSKAWEHCSGCDKWRSTSDAK